MSTARASLSRLVSDVEQRLGDVHDRLRRHPMLGEVYEFVDGSVGDFARDHGPMYAGALAFYGILSLIPLMVLLASTIGFVLSSGADVDAALSDVMVQLKKIIPYIAPEFQDDLRSIIAQRSRLGVIGFVALLIAASEVFRAVEFATARIFARLDHEDPDDKKTAPRNYFKSKLWFGAFATAVVLAFVAVRAVLGVGESLLQHAPLSRDAATVVEHVVGDPLGGTGFVGHVITALAITAGFVAVIRVFTSHAVKTRYAFVGGALFWLLFSAARLVFDFYISRLTNFGAMYGSFAALFVIIVWIYYSATLLVFCCHVVKVVQRRATIGPRYPKDGSWFLLRRAHADDDAS